jgi:hypothetical protein
MKSYTYLLCAGLLLLMPALEAGTMQKSSWLTRTKEISLKTMDVVRNNKALLVGLVAGGLIGYGTRSIMPRFVDFGETAINIDQMQCCPQSMEVPGFYGTPWGGTGIMVPLRLGWGDGALVGLLIPYALRMAGY